SHHYYYSQTINLNQPRPNVHGSFNEYKTTKSIKPEFPLKFFESEVSKFKIWPSENTPIVTNLLYPNGKIMR
uniref:Uncharacterized protein n=1 Tax=Schistosoma margrebowiei TaxID=48269 RepID=A0AA84ZDD8_9TREM